MTYEGMSGEELFARFREMNELGGRALQANNLAQAEGAYEEAARISGALARVEPRHDILLAYWHSLRNLAETLRRMGANPETEELLEEAVGDAPHTRYLKHAERPAGRGARFRSNRASRGCRRQNWSCARRCWRQRSRRRH